MNKFKTIIIDDNIETINVLSQLFKELFFDDIELIKTYDSALNGLKGLLELKPDVVFLDIEMPELNGIELTKMIPNELNCKIIIISGKDKYALDAIKLSVFDYLIKPISLVEIKKTIDKIKVDNSIQKAQDNNAAFKNKLLINRHDKTLIIDVNNISYIEADAACTIIYYENKKISSTKRFNHYESLLLSSKFVKIHRSCIVNVDYILEVVKMEGTGHLILKDGTKLELSKSKKDELISKLIDAVKK